MNDVGRIEWNVFRPTCLFKGKSVVGNRATRNFPRAVCTLITISNRNTNKYRSKPLRSSPCFPLYAWFSAKVQSGRIDGECIAMHSAGRCYDATLSILPTEYARMDIFSWRFEQSPSMLFFPVLLDLSLIRISLLHTTFHYSLVEF